MSKNESDDKQKQLMDENSRIVSKYLSYNILEPNLYLGICCLLSTFLFYQKVNDNFMAKWQAVFYPIYLYLIPKALFLFKQILMSDSISSHDISTSFLQIKNLNNIILISNCFSFIFYLILISCLYNIHNFLDLRKDEYLIIALYCLGASFVWIIIYNFIRKLSFCTLPNKNNDETNKSTFVAFISTLLAPLLTYVSNAMIICSGGACTQIYLSTITSLLGAFGVTLSELSAYMFPITCILMGISVFSLYIKRRKLKHKPFILGVVSAIFIIVGKYFEKTKISYLIYPGNIMMIGAAIWNARLNRFSGLPC